MSTPFFTICNNTDAEPHYNGTRMLEALPLWAGAFVAGVVSFLSPCVLPLVPGYLAIISGASLEELKVGEEQLMRRAFIHSLFFIAGFSIVFIALGAAASTIAGYIKLTLLTRLAGLLVILFGLHMAGVIKIGLLYRDTRVQDTKNPASAFGSLLMGLAFACGWTPCIGPILGGIIAIAATREHVFQGVVLLAIYSMGLAIPFLLTTLGLSQFLKFYQRFRRHLHTLEVASGILLVADGLLLATKQF